LDDFSRANYSKTVSFITEKLFNLQLGNLVGTLCVLVLLSCSFPTNKKGTIYENGTFEIFYQAFACVIHLLSKDKLIYTKLIQPVMTYNEDASYDDSPSCAFCAYAW